MRRSLLLLNVVLLLLFSLIAGGPAAEPQPPGPGDVTSLWDGIAHDHVRPGRIGDVDLNVVDYKGIAHDDRWPRLLEALENSKAPQDPKARTAFWINAYNILAVKVVLAHYPVESIKDAGGWFTPVWDIDAGMAAGQMRSLGEVEHEILRPMGEPRIHSAIVCASVSCPPLRAEAYRAEELDRQLDEQMRAWLGNTQTGARLEKEGGILKLSPILKWFAEDFEMRGGSVRDFIDAYLPAPLRQQATADARLSYLDYDWSLNDAAREGK